MAALTIPIQSIKRDSVSNQVFEELKKRILRGDFPVNGRLPAESALAHDFGVSRSSVRTALHRLETLGVVEIRVGEGSFIRERNFENIMAEVSALVAENSMVPYVRELRETIETEAIRLAIERASDAQLADFISVAEELLKIAQTGDEESYIEADYQFHLTLCTLSHNKLFELVYASIRDLFRLEIKRNVQQPKTRIEESVIIGAERHIALAKALAQRDLGLSLRIATDIFTVNPETQESENS